MDYDISSKDKPDGQCFNCNNRPVPAIVLMASGGNRLFRGQIPELTFCADCAKLIHRELGKFIEKK